MKLFFEISSIVLLFSFVILNQGFSNIGFVGIPIFQLISLLFIFCLLLLYPQTFNKFPKILIKPALILIGYSFVIFILSLFNGSSIIRIVQDYELIYNLGYILIGYFIAQQLEKEKLINLMSSLFLFCLIFSILFFSFETQIKQLSPIVGIFQKQYLLGNIIGHYYLLMVAGFFFLYVSPLKQFNILLFPIFTAASLFEQKRFSIIIFIIFFFNYFYNASSKNKSKSLFGILLIVLLVIFLNVLNIEGVRGNFSLSFFIDLYSSILGSSENELSYGVFWRLNIINDSFILLSNNFRDLLFGIGFGEPLSFNVDPITNLATRQSHIFLLDTFVRLGLVGFILTINLYLKFFRYFFESYKKSKVLNWFYIFSICVFLLSQTNPVLQVIHMAFPIYVILGFGIYLKESSNSRK